MRVSQIKPEEAEQKMESDPSMIILDIRDDEVYNSLRLPYDNQIHIPLAYLQARINEIPKDKAILIACHRGKQSVTAAPYLKSKGYEVVGCLDGGIMGWQKAGKPISN